jgi:hypothetical protein
VRLTDIYAELRRQAERTDQDRATELTGGARLCVRVRDQVVTLSIARRDKLVGDREISTFLACCGVPPSATRWPVEGQHQRTRGGIVYHQVVYRWAEQEVAHVDR